MPMPQHIKHDIDEQMKQKRKHDKMIDEFRKSFGEDTGGAEKNSDGVKMELRESK